MITRDDENEDAGKGGAPTDGEAVTIEKVMSLSASEFELSLATFLGCTIPPGTRRAEAVLPTGRAEIVYEPQAGVRLGGLLALPRAVVRLTFTGVPEAERETFLRKFDIAFQRGGG